MTDADRIKEIEAMLAEIQPYTEGYFETRSWSLWTQDNVDDLRYLLGRVAELTKERDGLQSYASVWAREAEHAEEQLAEMQTGRDEARGQLAEELARLDAAAMASGIVAREMAELRAEVARLGE